jgi:hypothetical protein
MKIPVEGNSNLYRDSESGAILNCSDIDYINYQEIKKKKIQEMQEIDNLKNKVSEIETIKSDLLELKSLMKELVLQMQTNNK